MNNMIDSESVVCRPALRQDTAQVMELSSHIWDGGDYIPMVWDRWMADLEGLLGVAELHGRVAGVFKLTKFREGEWWMEGLRVHPDFQGKGVASHIQKYIVETWRRIGSGVIRLATASFNVKVHHMSEQGGFKRIAEFIPYKAPVVQESINDFIPLAHDEAQKALDFVTGSPAHALSAGLINLGWMFANPHLTKIEEEIDRKQAWWWRDGAGFLSIFEDEEDDGNEAAVQLMGCSLADLPQILVDYRKLAGSLGLHLAGWMAPNHPQVIASLEKTGFERAWDHSLYIFELRSEGSQP